MPLKRWSTAAGLWFISYAWVHLGLYLGKVFIPAQLGYRRAGEVARDLFRFDAAYYLDIAQHGYAYGGDPSSSPNIVFAPLFPLLVRMVAYLGVPDIDAGFWLNEILFFFALGLWLEILSESIGPKPARTSLLLLVTSAGSYAFHAFYGESTMFFGLAVMCRGLRKNEPVLTALGGAWVGASRLAALPLAAFAAAVLTKRAVAKRSITTLILPAIALSGAAAYLGYIAQHFGEPFQLLRQIQETSWAGFHPADSDPWRILNFSYLARDFSAAWARGSAGVWDVRGWNLLWTLLGLGAAVHALLKRNDMVAWAFVFYVGFVYYASAASEFLISEHRFMVVVVPLFVMLVDLAEVVGRRTGQKLGSLFLTGLIALNAGLGVLHAAMFNQGVWFWF